VGGVSRRQSRFAPAVRLRGTECLRTLPDSCYAPPTCSFLPVVRTELGNRREFRRSRPQACFRRARARVG
jgi:hypothetical protein